MPGWAFSHLISRETLAARLPYKSLLPEAPEPLGGHLGHGQPLQLLLASSARASCLPSQARLDPRFTRTGQDSHPALAAGYWEL